MKVSYLFNCFRCSCCEVLHEIISKLLEILCIEGFCNGIELQTLLRYGANPDLRDEDGKTPLDKARERGDEGHREVIQILQSPGRVNHE